MTGVARTASTAGGNVASREELCGMWHKRIKGPFEGDCIALRVARRPTLRSRSDETKKHVQAVIW